MSSPRVIVNGNNVIVGNNAVIDVHSTPPRVRGRPSGRTSDAPLIINVGTKVEFPWIGADADNRHYCKLCTSHRLAPSVKAGNHWIIPRPPSLVRAYRDHAAADCHLAAVKIERGKADKRTVINGFAISAERNLGNLRNHFVIAHTLAITQSATHQYKTWMNVLMNIIKVPMISEHISRQAARRMQFAMGKSLQYVTRDAVLQSSLPFGILIDESTDVATKKSLIMYIKYIDVATFTPVVKFLALLPVPNSTGDGITNTVVKYLTDRHYPTERMTGFGSDGAAVMIGPKKGVATRIKRLIAFCSAMLAQHCTSHKSSLAAGDAVTATKDIEAHFDLYTLIITKIGTFFNRSAERTDLLQTKVNQRDEKSLKVIKHLAVRWLSTHTVSVRIVEIYDSIRAAVDDLSKIKSKSQESIIKLRNNISTFSFIATAYFMSAILAPVMMLNKATQNKILTINAVYAAVGICLKELAPYAEGDFSKDSSLTELFNNARAAVDAAGEAKTAQFFPKNNAKGLPVIVSDVDITSHLILFKEVSSQLIAAINDRFPDRPIVKSLTVFDFTKWPKPTTDQNVEALNKFGEEQIQKLIIHFRYAQLIDIETTMHQWQCVREIIINNYLDRPDLYGVWHALWMECGSDHPSVFTLAAIAFTLPMSTAECERGFSRQNITKTRLRNRLLHPMLDALLRIDINAKKWSDINEQDVLKRWESRTSDNFFKQLDETDETMLEHDLELIEDDPPEPFDWSIVDALYEQQSNKTIQQELLIKTNKRKRQRDTAAIIDLDVTNEEVCDENANLDIPMTESAESVTISAQQSVSLAPMFSHRGRPLTKTAKMSDYQLNQSQTKYNK